MKSHYNDRENNIRKDTEKLPFDGEKFIDAEVSDQDRYECRFFFVFC